MVNPAIVDNRFMAATLLAACGWNLLTWYWGLPTSSSHALIGGMVGAALALTGSLGSLKLGGLAWICLFIVLAALGLRRGSLRLRLDAALLAGLALSALLFASVFSLFDYRYGLGATLLLPAAAALAGTTLRRTT